jgi:hypothetical protein
LDPAKLFFLARPFFVFVAVAAFVACGGGGGGGSGNKGGGGPGTPALVTVTAGTTTGGVNISVASPRSNPTPNAKFLGVNLANGGALATGDTVSRSQGTATVTIFGPGLASSMRVTITGPGDITVGTLTAVTAQDGTPGVQFPITLTGSTALGARTVVMEDSSDDITTFTGGLEVVP